MKTTKTILLTLLVCSLIAPTAFVGCSDNDADKDAGVSDGGGGGDGGGGALGGQELLNACVTASACRIKAYPTLASCVDAYYTLYLNQGLGKMWDAIYRCVNNAGGDCTKVATCFGRRGTCDNTYQAACEGDVAVGCDLIDRRVYAVNCAAAGQTCHVRSDQKFSAICTPGKNCFMSSCEQDKLFSCGNGYLELRDCATEGLVCSSGKGSFNCVGNTSEKCKSGSYSPSCSGSVASECVGGLVAKIDCSKRTLRATKCSAGACVVAGSECDHSKNQCVGDNLKACIDGSWQTFDCAKLSLGKCRSYNNASNCSDPSL